MADARDEALRQRYRELATEEPSAALDDAIRAAARRAVSSGPGKVRKPGTARWAVPASLAAVLFLSFGVVMRLEKEAPPIVEPTPSTDLAVKKAEPSLAFAPKEAPASAPASTPVETAKESLSRDNFREQPRLAAPPALQKEKKDAVVVQTKPAEVPADSVAPSKPEPAPSVAAPAAPPAPAFVPPPPAESPRVAGTTSNTAPQSILVPAPAPARVAPASPMPPAAPMASATQDRAAGRRDEAAGALGATQQPRAKAESYAEKRIAQDVAAPWPDTPEKKLERIEALRKAGRDKEADEAISRFRREHPDYRIPDATWERIRAR